MIFEFSYTTKKKEKLWAEMLEAGVCGEMQLLCGVKCNCCVGRKIFITIVVLYINLFVKYFSEGFLIAFFYRKNWSIFSGILCLPNSIFCRNVCDCFFNNARKREWPKVYFTDFK